MPKLFNDLTEEQKNKYYNLLKRLGHSQENEVGVIRAHHLQAAAANNSNIVLSSLAEESHVPPHYTTINSLDELKGLVGFPDEDFTSGKRTEVISGSNHTATEGMLKAVERHDLTAEESAALAKAAENYIFGNSARVNPQMKEAFEKLNMPMQVAVFTSDDGNLTLDPGQIYTISGSSPVVLVYGTITMGAGSQIVATVETHINTQVLQQS